MRVSFCFANVRCVWSIIENVRTRVRVWAILLGKDILFWFLQLVKYIWNLKAVVYMQFVWLFFFFFFFLSEWWSFEVLGWIG